MTFEKVSTATETQAAASGKVSGPAPKIYVGSFGEKDVGEGSSSLGRGFYLYNMSNYTT